ncbi:aminotransferase [Bacillus oleivorans]|uniref:Aminotransferase n=1 Tax=Bacillus oleivorans TaxID=1448271 RepID=A0A285D452_9BACI|nr:aminotransferase A [Bacillus oleivorans]SNX73913.1 aminotransferase [Bacillus oleivorans]
MESLLNENVKNIQISGIRKFFNLVAEYDHVVSLTIGVPDFPTPDHVKEAAIRAIQENITTYTHNAGRIDVRKAACHFVKEKYKLQYNENEVIVTVGASEAIDIALRTILSKGDEVILPGPVYPGYEPLIQLSGGIPIYADVRQNGFKLTADIVEKYITEQTKCIILPYPSNPTGVSLEADELTAIASLVKEKNIFVIADEIYSELTYGRTHVSIAQFLKEQTILINGLSKSHAMTGWRIGLLFGPEKVVQNMLKVHQYNVSCATSISQMAALEALTNGINDALPMREEYQNRRDYCYQELTKMGIDVVLPDGAFYFFVPIPTGEPSFQFATNLLREQRIAVVPGDAFSSLGEGYFRMSYSCSMQQLEKGLNGIRAYLAGFGNN